MVDRLMTVVLNGVSIFFKTFSLINLKAGALRPKKYPGTLIVSIDNLSFGGTGKTTLVMEIGQLLEQHNITFAIVTRGYKSRFEKKGIKVQPHHSISEIGDEAGLFRTRFPHQDIYIGKNRHASIASAIRDHNKIILLDDGFQTTNLYKDIKIMLLNPAHPYYYLRNFKFLVKQEDFVFLYRPSAAPPRPNTSGGEKPVYSTYDFQLGDFFDAGGKRLDREEVQRATLLAFCGLGDNRRFKGDLSGFNLVEFKGFGDHHRFTDGDLKRLNQRRIEKKAGYLVCTEKDFVKIRGINLTGIPLIYVQNRIKLKVNLFDRILSDARKKSKI